MITGGRSFVSSPPAFSNDAKRLLVCTGNTISIFSTSTGLQTSELEGHKELVTSVIVVPASKVLNYCWTASLDGTIKYWDFAAPELMRSIDIKFPIHSMAIPSLLTQNAEGNENRTDLFAYLYIEGVKKKDDQHSFSCGQIRKCNLMMSRRVGGVTLAETRKPGSLTISPSGNYIGMHEKRKIQIWEISKKDSENVADKRITLHHTKKFTTLAFHPTDMIVAAGDVTGRILLWRGVGCRTFANSKKVDGGVSMDTDDRPGVRDNDDADSCTTWHWHSSQVNVLFFSSDGAYLYSGGKEGVLVVWQLETGKNKFLPRIGSPLTYFINSVDPSLAAISSADNQIRLLRMPSMEILKSISGIKLPSSLGIYAGFGSGVVINRSAGLIAVPTENYRVQLYSLFDDREISEVQICERNHHPGDEITIKVHMVALSPDCSTLCTVETRLPEEGIGSLVSLKFWACGSQNRELNLSTVIYEPHRDAEISSIAFHPTRDMVVSSSYGGDFKVWVRRHDIPQEDQTIQNSGWSCHAVGSYKNNPMTAAAFSSDGSVLAVAAAKVITLWDPDRNILVAVMGESIEPISALSFVGKSEYLVSASRGSNPQLIISSMSTQSVSWSYRLHIEDITCSSDGSTFAVLAQSQSAEATVAGGDGVILLFNVENPVPVSTWRVKKAKGGRLSFVKSNHKFNDDSETKGANEVLAYVDGSHEYVLWDPRGEHSISRQQTYNNNLEETERFGYASVYGELPEFSLKVDRAPLSLMQSDKTWKTIFSGPSHCLPPLQKLCSDYVESLLERRPEVVE